jgi:endonuclease YncB( thermonuclease family)
LHLVEPPQGSAFATIERAEFEKMLPVGSNVLVEPDALARGGATELVGYVFLTDGRMLNEELVSIGLANAGEGAGAYADRLHAAADAARAGKRGLWATSAFGGGR